MDKFIARQPIFDTQKRVVAYELLFRSGPQNFFTGRDADAASSQLIDDSLHVFGIDAQPAPGYYYTRQPQIRITKDFDKKLWLSLSAEIATMLRASLALPTWQGPGRRSLSEICPK